MYGAKQAAEAVFDSLVAKLMTMVYGVLTLAGWAAAAVIAAAFALFFFTFAAFVWAEQNYGTLEASLLLGAFFLVVAGAILITVLVLRRRRRPPKRTPPQWWKDPTIVATGVELVRVVGLRRIVPVVALGAIIVGALQGSPNQPRR